MTCEVTEEQIELFEEVEKCFHHRDSCEHVYGDKLEKIGKGHRRSVFALDKDCVVKIPHYKHGRHETKDEAEFYDRLTYKASKNFAKVHDFDEDGKWLVMNRVNTDQITEEDDPRIKEWENTVALRRILCNDSLPKNFGTEDTYSGERVVRIDYGKDCTINPRSLL